MSDQEFTFRQDELLKLLLKKVFEMKIESVRQAVLLKFVSEKAGISPEVYQFLQDELESDRQLYQQAVADSFVAELKGISVDFDDFLDELLDS